MSSSNDNSFRRSMQRNQSDQIGEHNNSPTNNRQLRPEQLYHGGGNHSEFPNDPQRQFIQNLLERTTTPFTGEPSSHKDSTEKSFNDYPQMIAHYKDQGVFLDPIVVNKIYNSDFFFKTLEKKQNAERELLKRKAKTLKKDVYTGTDRQDTLERREFLDGIDSINRDELNAAKMGFERFKKLVENAPEDIKQFFICGDTGAKIQAMCLGVKPVIFDLTGDIDCDTSPNEGWSDNDAYRKHLVRVVQPTYQKIKDHIIQTDISSDIRFIDQATRDYSRKDDPYIHFEGDVTLVEGDHAIYSYSSVKKLFNDHKDIFPHDNSDDSIRSFISKYQPDEFIEIHSKVYGLLCGYPRYAVEEYCNPTANRRELTTIHLLGRTYMNKSGDERDNIADLKDQDLFHHSGMGDFIDEALTKELF